MNVGDTVKVVEYPDEKVVGFKGIVTHIAVDDEDYHEVELFGSPFPERPHYTNFLFYDQEIEVI